VVVVNHTDVLVVFVGDFASVFACDVVAVVVAVAAAVVVAAVVAWPSYVEYVVD